MMSSSSKSTADEKKDRHHWHWAPNSASQEDCGRESSATPREPVGRVARAHNRHRAGLTAPLRLPHYAVKLSDSGGLADDTLHWDPIRLPVLQCCILSLSFEPTPSSMYIVSSLLCKEVVWVRGMHPCHNCYHVSMYDGQATVQH